MTLTNAQIETICEDCIGTFPGMTTRANMEALRDLALAAKEMEEELAKARYHVLGYKGDYDELCKRYTTCERELGSVMKERDAMREAIKRAVAVLTNPSVEDLFNLRAYLESVLQGEAVSDFTCPKCGTGLNYVTGPVEPRAAEVGEEAIPVSNIEAEIAHIKENGQRVRELPGMTDEGRCRELCAMYLQEFIYNLRAEKKLRALFSRPAIIEECARVAVEHGELCVRMGNVEKARTAATIADAIRALAPREGMEEELKIRKEEVERWMILRGDALNENHAMREAIKRAEQDLLGIHVKAEHSDKLRSICARLVQSLNPKNEEKS